MDHDNQAAVHDAATTVEAQLQELERAWGSAMDAISTIRERVTHYVGIVASRPEEVHSSNTLDNIAYDLRIANDYMSNVASHVSSSGLLTQRLVR